MIKPLVAEVAWSKGQPGLEAYTERIRCKCYGACKEPSTRPFSKCLVETWHCSNATHLFFQRRGTKMPLCRT